MALIKSAINLIYGPNFTEKYSREVYKELNTSNCKNIVMLSYVLIVFSSILAFYFYFHSDQSNQGYKNLFRLYVFSIFWAVFLIIFFSTIAKKILENNKYRLLSFLTFLACFVTLVWSMTISITDQMLSGSVTCYIVVCFLLGTAFYLRLAYVLILFIIPTSVLLISIFYIPNNQILIVNHLINVIISVFLSIIISRILFISRVKEVISKIQLEEQIIILQKMSFLGESLAEIVHNLKNPIMLLMGYGELLKSYLPDSDIPDKLLGAVDRIENIVKTILRSSRSATTLEYQDVDINQVMKNEIQLLLAAGYEKYDVNISLGLTYIPLFKCIPSHISQCLANILKNAYEAMYSSKNKILKINTLVNDKNEIVISISDTGSGITKENISKIFETFFTTKPSQSSNGEPIGNGLGLPYTKKIIESYGGTISVESQIGIETTFTIILPINN